MVVSEFASVPRVRRNVLPAANVPVKASCWVSLPATLVVSGETVLPARPFSGPPVPLKITVKGPAGAPNTLTWGSFGAGRSGFRAGIESK